ncbi:MAG: hypothetical protein AB7K71_00310 [Polyangiaceae bacterium]
MSALEPAAREALAWFVLADVAVWPQVSTQDAQILRGTLAGGPGAVFSTPDYPARRLAMQAIQFLSSFDASSLWSAQQRVIISARRSEFYWEEWLRRVVPMAAVTSPDDAKGFAVGALSTTFPTPPIWNYEAGMLESGEIVISGVEPDIGGKEFVDVGVVENVKPVNRAIRAIYTPKLTTDAYRMGYFLQTTILSAFIDSHDGRYDTMEITNIQTGEVWSGRRY